MKKLTINRENREVLYEALLTLKTTEECKKFLDDLCTVNELESISQRLVVAKLLTENKVYIDIVEKTGASTATISRVNRTLRYGTGGYEMIFERLAEKE
ncbi:MAG: YerC/YecD family TrpR-related protein [Bacteroides sp.]|nr:YerC/YecD family TrpR-related protein [Eubacterium sp.]MCM1418283.1 YerC/YecD family TrpR-related protein [Roseburia sp.]MCM1462386.1 YerC/YecD family TrpR-related protein [Bacteroides sp.]